MSTLKIRPVTELLKYQTQYTDIKSQSQNIQFSISKLVLLLHRILVINQKRCPNFSNLILE